MTSWTLSRTSPICCQCTSSQTSSHPRRGRPWIFKRIDYVLRSFDPAAGISETDRLTAQLECFQYAQDLSEQKRADPTDDIWTTLTRAEVPDDDGEPTRLSDVELDAFS